MLIARRSIISSTVTSGVIFLEEIKDVTRKHSKVVTAYGVKGSKSTCMYLPEVVKAKKKKVDVSSKMFLFGVLSVT